MTAPAPASPAYRADLADVFAAHDHAANAGDEGLEHFIDAQLVWDRAMASGLAEASAEGKLVVGLMGYATSAMDTACPISSTTWG